MNYQKSLRQLLRSGMSQAQIAEKLGTTQATVSRWLKGSDPRGKFHELIASLAEDASREHKPSSSAMVMVPEMDRFCTGAGNPAIVDGEEIRSEWQFSRSYLNSYLGVEANNLSIIEVRGDSMEPTLSTGERVMIYHGDIDVTTPGIFCIYDGTGTVIKRVELDRDKDPVEIKLISDNKIHGDYSVAVDSIKIIGRVVWAARRL